jgi:hypothetical protein
MNHTTTAGGIPRESENFGNGMSAEGGYTEIAIPMSAGLENIPDGYLYVCSNFSVDNKPSSAANLLQIGFNSGMLKTWLNSWRETANKSGRGKA